MPPNDRSSRPPPSLSNVRPERVGHAPPPRRPGPPDPRSGYREPEFSAPRTDPHRRPPPVPQPVYDEPQPESRRSLGRTLVFGFLGLVALIVVGVGVLVASPPVDLVRARVIAEVERQTGRKLEIGSAGVSFASGLGVALSGLSLSAPPGMSGPPMLTAERMEVTLALLPLVFREVQIDRLTVVAPVLDLRVDASGRRSWEFAALETAPTQTPLRYAQAAAGTTNDAGLPSEVKDFVRNGSPPGAGRLVLDSVSLPDVRIVGGRVRYADARTGARRELSKIDAQLSLPSIAGAMNVKGRFETAGEQLAIDGRIDQLRELLADRPFGARIKVDGRLIEANYDGKLAVGAQPQGEGRLLLKVTSAADLARILALPLSGLETLGPMTFDGQARLTGNGISVNATGFSLGATAGAGTIGVDTAGDRPKINANLRFAALDTRQFAAVGLAPLPARASAAEAPPATTATNAVGRFAVPAARSPNAPPPQSIDDLIEREAPATANPATRVRGFLKRAGNQWDIDAIDATPLRLADIDARVQAASLKTASLDAANVQLGVELKGGVLRLSVTDAQVAGGAVRGLTSIDARQPSLTVGINLSGDNVALKPLLEAAGVDLLDGRGRVIVAVSAQGASERELVSSLAGRAEVKAADGALLGWDADAILAGLAQGRMPPPHRQQGARTPFKEISGTFQIAQGVARTKDLKLESPSVSATGTGLVNIVDRNIDLLLKPRAGAGGIEIPVRIAGNWDDPKVVADVNAALKSPQAQEAVKQLKDGNVEGALRSVLGNGPKADEKIGKAKEVLRGILAR